MLILYPQSKNFEKFCETMYEKHRNQKINIEQIQLDYDFLILNKSKYKVEDIDEYIEFYKYKAIDQKIPKISIINKFDCIDKKIQNKLLKIFEEQEAIQIICSSKKKMILPTILSRSVIKNYEEKNYVIEKFPSRYQKLLNYTINSEEELKEVEKNDTILEQYIKFYELCLNNKYDDAFIYFTVNSNFIDSQKAYKIIEYAETNKEETDLEGILELQERLNSNSNQNIQIENYLIQRIKGG